VRTADKNSLILLPNLTPEVGGLPFGGPRRMVPFDWCGNSMVVSNAAAVGVSHTSDMSLWTAHGRRVLRRRSYPQFQSPILKAAPRVHDCQDSVSMGRLFDFLRRTKNK
jgi:hypothetical protein